MVLRRDRYENKQSNTKMVGVSPLWANIPLTGCVRATLQRKARKFSAYVQCDVCKTLGHSEIVCCGESMCVSCYFWRHTCNAAMGIATGAASKSKNSANEKKSTANRPRRGASAKDLRQSIFSFTESETSKGVARKTDAIKAKKSRTRNYHNAASNQQP